MTSFGKYIIGGLIGLALAIGFVGGMFLYPRLKPCPVITTTVEYVYDNTWYHIADSLMNLPPNEKIKWLPQDTLFVPADTVFKDVDTLAILKDYFSVYEYKWNKLDTGLLEVQLFTTVSRNMPLKYDLHYKILRPQEITYNNIDNSVTYNKYLQLGLSLPVYSYSNDTKVNLNNLGLEASYIFPKGYLGTRWQPNTESFELRLGATILKFKQNK